MDIIKTIRTEIDRRYEENRERARYDDYYRGMNDGLDSFESFLDTLESEKPTPNDLEEAAEKHLDTVFGRGKHQPFYKVLFIAGAKWQAKHTPLPEDTVLFNKGVAEGKRLAEEELSDLLTIAHLQGADQMKEQILKDGNVILTEEDFDAEKEKSMEWGYNLCKEQMMKEAVEGYVDKDHIVTVGPCYFYRSRNIELPPGLAVGDKVRVIIVKDEK